MKTLFLIGFVLIAACAFSQDTLEKKKTWTLSGYLKELVWVRFDKNFKYPTATNLLHNRINAKWNPSKNWNGSLEVRNRFYWGEDVHKIQGFKNSLRNENEALNLSVNWIDAKSALLNSNVERLSIEYRKPKWNVRVGRQRINWGINNTWNPNDLFNTYNFLDFDYEERPGSDAVKGQYLINDFSTVEIAFAGTGHKNIAAAKYFTNFKKYDLQANAGFYKGIFTVGLGWAGNISEAGFKGEVQIYTKDKDTSSNVLAAIESDYMLKNGWYLSSALLYNQRGLNSPLHEWTKLSFQPSPRNLMPTKWNILLNTSKEFTPLFTGSLNVVYAPGVNLLILFPTLRYNLTTDLDLDFVWQSFFAETTRFEAVSHTGYVRLKWSF